ncbi:MAG TPA: hypothetical protein VMG12_36640 [Polyangiaceae bacterium]|nr:hypothetical protein [Polyangiaceae bacterium]
MYSIGLISDAFAEVCRQGAWLTLPSLTPSDALPLMGRDRGLERGLFEPQATYRERLKHWRYPRGHRVRGSALALLEQVSVALRGTEWTTIDARGTRVDKSSGVFTRNHPWDWDGQALTPNWGRYWLAVQTGQPWPSFADGAWGPKIKAADKCVGMSGVHPGEVDAVRRLTKPNGRSWTPAGRRPIYMTIYFPGGRGSEAFPTPTGDWDSWANREPAHRYVPLHSSVT